MRNFLSALLYPYALSQEEKRPVYTARLSSSGKTLNNADICHHIATCHPTSLSEETLLHAVSAYFENVADLLCNGYTIANGYFTVRASIKGTFLSPGDHFNPQRHRVDIEFQQGAALRKRVGSIKVNVMGVAQNRRISEVTDVTTGSVNHLLTPHGMLIVEGKKLKISGDNPAVGVYFTNSLTGEVYKLPGGNLPENHPARLLLIIPDLPAGEYQLSVVTQYVGRSTPTRQPVTATLHYLLTAVDSASPLGNTGTLTRSGQPDRPGQVGHPDPDGSETHISTLNH
ncbi:MAG: DUF4469 domain-containing protein [Prevotellaceae bacterium]|jgi:hypothetical protein|nr:DUF4469 domain-containing protein [Prevotellaceae bacterium]